jgi:hypothetical protein
MSFDLLEAVLPTEGRYCIVGIGKYTDQRFAETREEADEIIEEFKASNVNVFFACSKFGPLNNRTHENVAAIRALWIDLDCGPTKGVPNDKGIIEGYLDQQIGLAELQKFCKAVGLPKPILVNSGNGIHAYWLIEQTLTRREWEPLAGRLKELCAEHGLIVDRKVFEASRILRVPDTMNVKKDKEPKPVHMWNEESPRMTYEQVRLILGEAETAPKEVPDFIPQGMSPMMEALMQNKVKRFSLIMMKAENGCAQLNHCYNNQQNLDEPLWQSALSITAFCVDGDKAAHKMSEDYDRYDPSEVDTKLANLRKNGGPHLCTTFEERNPGGCDGCPHKGKIKSPIMLGVEIAEAEDDEFIVQDEETGETTRFVIPDYPFPFFRGKNGGVYLRPPPEAEDEPKLVYEHDFYLVKRMTDPETGEVVLFRLHLPHDGVREFSLTAAAICSKDELRKLLAHHGVVTSKAQYDALSAFVVSSLKNLQYEKKAEKMRTQYGWADGDSKFIVGDREVTKDGVFYSPPSSTTEDVVDKVHVQGEFDKWKEVFNLYAQPGLEPHAFAALTAFGSPLLKFTGLEGAIINLISPESGSGKSTALFMCNSVTGQPKQLTSMFKDTLNAKLHRLGVMNNLANTIDEITNMTGMEFSDLVYSVSQGRGKDRMQGQTNTLRKNNTTWQGITLCSSNASFYEKLGVSKSTPDGESMRLLEYRIAPTDIIPTDVGKQMFDHQLRDNYGHAIEPYVQWLVNNLEEAVELMRAVQAKIDKEVQFSARERFWSGVVACNIAGGLIARRLGLHSYDMSAIYEWVKVMLSEMRHEIKPPQSTPVTTIGDFINSHINNVLVVNGIADARTNMDALPLMEPRGELMVRYEPDTKELFISAKAFKEYCVRNQINYKGALGDLTKIGVFKEAMNKRMSKGMKVVAPAVRVLRFDASNHEFLHLEAEEAEAKDEDRDSVVSDQLA